MNIPLWTVVFIGLASANIMFKKRGAMSEGLTYGHITTVIDLNHTSQVLNETMTTMQRMEIDVYTIIDKYGLSQRYVQDARPVFEQYKRKLHSYKQRLQVYKRMLGQDLSARTKRQVLLGISSLLGLGLGLFQETELQTIREAVENQQKQEDELIKIVDKEEVQIHKNTELVRRLATQFNRLVKEVKREHVQSTIAGLRQSALELMEATADEMNRWFNGLNRIIVDKKMPPEFINQERMDRVYEAMVTEAAKSHLTPVMAGGGCSVYEVEASIVQGEDQQLLVVAHVPLSTQERYEIMEHIPAPFSVANTTMIADDQEKRLLVINRQRSVYTEITSKFLIGCLEIRGFYFCESPLHLRKDLSRSCLTGLFLANQRVIKAACTLRFVRPREEVYQIDKHEYLMYAPTTTTVRMICQQNTTTFQVLGERKLTVPPGCTFSSDVMFLTSLPTIRIHGDVVANVVEWQVSHLVDEDDVQHLHVAFEEFKESTKEEEDVANLIKQIKQQSSHHVHMATLHLNLIVGVIVVVLLAFFGYLFMRTRAQARGQGETEMQQR